MNPTREELKPKVIKIISAVAVVDSDTITENNTLLNDLGLTKTEVRMLSVPFTKISKYQYNGRRVTRNLASKMETVKSAIDTVTERSQIEAVTET